MNGSYITTETSSLETFSSLEEDFVQKKLFVNNNIHVILQNNGSVTSEIQQVEAAIAELKRCLKLMSIELRGKAAQSRNQMQGKVTVYQNEMDGMIRDFERAKLRARENKALSSSSRRDPNALYERVQSSTQRLQRSSTQLEQSRRLVAETEQIGFSVLDSLSQQREGLLSAHQKVRETQDVTRDTRILLKRMTRRILKNHLILWSVIVLLVIAICFVIYQDFIRPTRSSFW
ncbi:hypothetical protein ABG067_000305 [Albugo candida]|uniref:Vesicle transport v-SNARE N-terminal domain-containing protein n=1 Tax=Albugo candida TaxID=65357 RepID=A0A024G7R4_9STRA|nr:unnamed protein product [Albugo candida]|eukprot:CCI42793.1 unnamed protein product [Albugo candida]